MKNYAQQRNYASWFFWVLRSLKKVELYFREIHSIHNFNDILKYRPWIAYYLLKFFAVKVATVVVNISKELNLVFDVSASINKVIDKTLLHDTTASCHNQCFFLILFCISLSYLWKHCNDVCLNFQFVLFEVRKTFVDYICKWLE